MSHPVHSPFARRRHVPARTRPRWVPAAIALLLVSSAVIGDGVALAQTTPTCRTTPGFIEILGTDLYVTADAGDANDITITLIGGSYTPPGTGTSTSSTYRVTDPGGFSAGYSFETRCASDPAAMCTRDPNDPLVATCSAIIHRVFVESGDLDDKVSLAGVPAPASVAGGTGNDRLTGGTNDDTLLGGDQDDTLLGGGGSNTLNGNADSDTAEFSDETAGVTADLLNGTATRSGGTDTLTGIENLLGGSGSDGLGGDGNPNRIDGGPGNDVANGRLGDDFLAGGDDQDVLIDSTENTGGTEEFHGGGGHDRLIGGTGFNSLFGNEGNDWLISGCDSADPVREGSLLSGGDGDDTLSNSASCASFAGEGRDDFFGEGGADTADFCAEDNPFSPSLPLGYRPLPTRDWTACGRTLPQTVTAGPDVFGTASRTDGFASENDEIGHSVESVIGGGGDDRLQGGPLSSFSPAAPIVRVNGATGADRLAGRFGHVLIGGPGGPSDAGDTLGWQFGGPGYVGGTCGNGCADDTRWADYSTRTSRVEVSLDETANDGEPGEVDNAVVESVIGGAGNDRIVGRSVAPSDNTLEGRGGDDELLGVGGDDELFGGIDDDTLNGGTGTDEFDAGPGTDEILARDGTPESIECGTGTDKGKRDRSDVASNCENVLPGVTAHVSAGGSLSSDVEGDGATSTNPVEATVTTPNAGTVEIEERPTMTANPAGWTLLGTEYVISAPSGTPTNPLLIKFVIHGSKVPNGEWKAVQIYRNGVPVGPCKQIPVSPINPDPCEDPHRMTRFDSVGNLLDVTISIWTTTASTWNVAADVTPPGISVTSPQQGQDVVLGAPVTANYTCSDQGSGIKTCTGSVPNGSALDTSSVGQKSLTVNASDNAGNTASETRDYRVIYDFDGFFQPVNDGALNVVRAGAGVPVKFSLNGNQGMDIFPSDSPQSKRIECDGAATSDPVEETVTAGQSGLTYASASDTYTYVWKTNRDWAGTCRRLNVRLDDGTEHTADFSFTRP